MTKKLLSLLLALSLIFVFALPAFAEEEIVDDGSYTASNGYSYAYFAKLYDFYLADTELNPHQYENVWDFAGILTDSEEASLQAQSEADKAEKGINTYFLTYDEACGADERTFTDDFYDYYITKLDFDNEVDGILYAVDMDNRQLYINTAGKYADLLSSSEAYNLLDRTYSKASDGDYYGFFKSTDNYTLKKLFPSVAEKLMPTKTSLIASVVVAIIVVITLITAHKKGNSAPSGQTYLNNFNVINRNAIFMGHREEVIHDFYKQSSSSGGGGGGHSSGGGGSHGGGGHGF